MTLKCTNQSEYLPILSFAAYTIIYIWIITEANITCLFIKTQESVLYLFQNSLRERESVVIIHTFLAVAHHMINMRHKKFQLVYKDQGLLK